MIASDDYDVNKDQFYIESKTSCITDYIYTATSNSLNA